MRKIFQYIAMAVAVVAMASCSQEEMFEPVAPQGMHFSVSEFPAYGDMQTRAIGTQDAGKTEWADNDKLLLSITFKSGKKQGYTLEYQSEKWSLKDKVLAGSDITEVLAVYAPDCEIKSDGSIGLVSDKLYGMAEYIPATTSFDGFNVSISFTDVTRTYSRLRIASDDRSGIFKVTFTNFTPAGASESVKTYEATLTPDDKLNMYLYGMWSTDSKVTVTNASDGKEIVSHSFIATDFNRDGTVSSSVPGCSYALMSCGLHEKIGNVSYTPSEDHSFYTATGTCEICGALINETAEFVLDTEPDADGNYYSRAKFQNTAFEEQSKLSYQVKDGIYYVYDSKGLFAWHDKAATDLTSNLTLEADIDMTNAGNWEPFGSHNSEYTGTVEGNNHTITGLTVSTSRRGAGFIGYLKDGTVKNLHLRDVSIINNNSTNNEDIQTGGIVGYLNFGTIINCSVTGSVSASTTARVDNVGGIVGVNLSGKVIGCYNEAAVTGHSTVGGIAGNSTGSVIGCYNVGHITQSSTVSGTNAGGIVGYGLSRSSILASYNIGNMTDCKAAPGGIVGSLSGASNAADCYWAVAANASKPADACGYIFSSHTGTVVATKITDGNWTTAMTAMNTAIATWNASNDNLCSYHYEINTGDDAATRPLILTVGAPQ